MREKAIAEYHQALTLDRELNSRFFARLKSGMTALHMLHGDRPLGVSLRPHLLTRSQYNHIAAASETLVGALDQAASALLAEPALMHLIGLTDVERRLAAVHPGYAQPAVTSRLDAFVVDHEVKFVEYNAENPSSLADQVD